MGKINEQYINLNKYIIFIKKCKSKLKILNKIYIYIFLSFDILFINKIKIYIFRTVRILIA
jgi:hypothetical protein